MNRAQRPVALVFCCAVAGVLFLSAGPLAQYEYVYPRPTGGATTSVFGSPLDSTAPTGGSLFDAPASPPQPQYVPKYPWNPLAGSVPPLLENPLIGIATPLALVGLGLFVFFGKGKAA